MVKAVAVVGGNQLQDSKLSPLRHSQINAETKTSGGGEGQPETVALPSQTAHTFTGWHVLQHVRLQQTRLLLQSNTNQQSSLQSSAHNNLFLMDTKVLSFLFKCDLKSLRTFLDYRPSCSSKALIS